MPPATTSGRGWLRAGDSDVLLPGAGWLLGPGHPGRLCPPGEDDAPRPALNPNRRLLPELLEVTPFVNPAPRNDPGEGKVSLSPWRPLCGGGVPRARGCGRLLCGLCVPGRLQALSFHPGKAGGRGEGTGGAGGARAPTPGPPSRRGRVQKCPQRFTLPGCSWCLRAAPGLHASAENGPGEGKAHARPRSFKPGTTAAPGGRRPQQQTGPMASRGAPAASEGPLGRPCLPALSWDALLGALVALARMQM